MLSPKLAKRLARRALVCTAAVGALATATTASADGATQKIRYRGQVVRAPASWPVYRLARDPTRCVRLDRRAVYLGSASPDQLCPAHAIGRRRAIVVAPPGERPAPLPRPASDQTARTSGATASFYTGLGFDACAAPSTTTMAAWLYSPYRAIGVYIGGLNRGCSQPNLTSIWVATEIAAGWGLIPIYVGRQAPSNSCGCAAIKPSSAAAQGTVAADDAIVQASLLGIGAGSPIYFDMEGYARTATNTSAVLTFLDAWTQELHANGYLSGVYGSAASTIVDLVGQYGPGPTDPDDVWIARWNGQQSTVDPVVPSTYWANHQRLHQYRGGHNERYGGATINIDNNYLDGDVVGHASRPKIPPLRCRKAIFSRRPKSIAFRIRTVNMLHCGKARRIAKESEARRYTARGRDRGYVKVGLRCRGHRRGRSAVTYKCRGLRGRARISFVRKG